MTVDSLLEKLEDVKAAAGGYVALCPAHEDTQASLSIGEGDNEILLKCHAGCTVEKIVEALEIDMADLFFGERERKQGINYAEPEVVYDYVDEYGNMIFQALRFPGKQFRQRHRNEDDTDWIWNMQDVRRVLYRLPEVIEARLAGRTIYLVEGEKDVEAIRATGHVATCNPMGAGKWRPEYTQMLTGAKVIIVADRDEPGRNHAENVKRELMPVASAVWVVQAKVGKDVSDHLAAGYALNELAIRRQRARKGIVTAYEMAQAGLEELSAQPDDIPSYNFSPVIPVEFRPGRVYAIGAYTSDGKTRFGLQGLRHLAQQGVHTGYYSLEMPERDLRNILAAHRGVPLKLTEHPWMLRADPTMMELYKNAMQEIGTWEADIIFESGMHADKIIEYTRDREYDVIVVDHLHRFSWGSERRNFEEQVQKLTNLALDANVCVVLMCQLRRQTRGKDMEVFPEPTAADFRESGVIEQEASMALSIWRNRIDGIRFAPGTKVTILKNRHTTGATDAAGYAWHPVFDVERQCFMPQQHDTTAEGGGTDGSTVASTEWD